MLSSEQYRFDRLYQCRLRSLKLQGLSEKTIDVYARAVRRIAQRYDSSDTLCAILLDNSRMEVWTFTT